MKKIRWITFTVVVLFLAFASAIHRESQKVLKEQVTAWEQDHSADCAIVLTGGPSRVREGMDLLSQKNIKKLIISGVFPGSKLREIFSRWPFYGEVNESNVILEKRSTTTYGNAQQSLPLAEALNCRDIILVTSRLHMYRSYKTFRAIFPQDISIQKRTIAGGEYRPRVLSLYFEAVKSLFYKTWAY